MDVEDQETEVDSVDETIAEALAELQGGNDEQEQNETTAEAAGDEQSEPAGEQAPQAQDAQPEGEDAPADVEQPATESQQPDVGQAPQSWGKAVQEHWGTLPQEVRDTITKREKDIHQMLTRHDGELRLGREMQQVVAPYMPVIRARNTTPAAVLSDGMNIMYIMNEGTQEQKEQLVANTIKQYGLNVEKYLGAEEYVDPEIAAMRKEISELRKAADPEVIQNQLTETQMRAKVDSDIEAFASDPANKHFETVRPLMVSLIQQNAAGNLKEAYDMACNAHPEIRSTLEAEKLAEQNAKRQNEMNAKKHAAASITGSPASSNASARKTPVNSGNSDPEDDIREALAEQRQSRA